MFLDKLKKQFCTLQTLEGAALAPIGVGLISIKIFGLSLLLANIAFWAGVLLLLMAGYKFWNR